MRGRNFVSVCAGVGFAAALAACSSPTQSINFRAPSGWTATPSFFGFQAWTTSDHKQVLVLMRFPVTGDVNQAIQHSNISNLQTTTERRITICGNHPAMYVSGRGENSSTHTEQQMEMVFTTYPSSTYVAIYSRNVGVASNAEAERAITSLCQHS